MCCIYRYLRAFRADLLRFHRINVLVIFLCQLILINLKVAQFRHCSTGMPQRISCSSCNSPHGFPLFSNLNISIDIAQLYTKKVPFFQHVLLQKLQCSELLANIITRVPTNFRENASLLSARFSHWAIRTIPRSCQKCTWKARSTLKRLNLVSSKQFAAQNTRTFHTSLSNGSSFF